MKKQLYKTVMLALLCSFLVVVSGYAQVPAPWESEDIGPVEVEGSAEEDAGVFTVTGYGSIWNPPDAFHYVYQAVEGDGEIIAHLDSYDLEVNEWTKVGLMIRQNLDTDAKSFLLFSSPGPVGGTPWGINMQARVDVGAESIWLGGPGGEPAPIWLKVTKEGNNVKGYTSDDGVTWTYANGTSVEMEGEIFVGLAVASTMPATTVTAQFSSVTVSFGDSDVAGRPGLQLPEIMDLAQNYPNPFNPTTRIDYMLDQKGQVKLTVYDILGHERAVLVNEEKDAGNYTVQFDASALSTGVYYYKLQSASGELTRKMMIVK